MAFRSVQFLPRFAKPRKTYPFPSLLTPQISSLHNDVVSTSPPNQTTPYYSANNLDERLILHQISHLFPTPTPKPDSPISNHMESKPVDAFLPPEEKLHRIFLKKLKGKSVIEQALSSVGVTVAVEILVKVVNSGNMSGQSMVTFFNWGLKQPLVPKKIGTYCIIVKALGRRKFFNFMMGVLCEMRVERVVQVDLLMLLSIVIDSFVKAGHVSKAIHVFNNLDDYFLGMNHDTEALNVVLSCLCKRSHVGAASSVMRSMRGKVAFDVNTSNVVAAGWSKVGRVSEVERIVKEMEDDGFCPDCTTFSFFIEGLGRAGRVDDAVEVFCTMKEEKNFQLDTACYNAMIFNFVSVGDFDGCMKYYNGMLSDNCEPNVNTYTRIITAFLRVRKVADALEMFDEMLGRGIVPSTGTVTSIVKRLCSYGPPYAALIIYKKARKLGCTISMDGYKIMLTRLSKFGKCGTMLSMWQEMQDCGYSSDVEVYEFIISGLCNLGQLENAVLVMEESLYKGFCPSRLVYSKLSNKLLASNKIERD